MASVARTAGAAGSVTLTTRNTAGQLITPVSAPVVRWYTDAARTLGEVTLPVTGSGSTYTATWTAAQAPAATSPRYLVVTIEVSTGVFDTDADDDISFVDATSVIDSRYVTRAELRALPNLSDAAKFTDAELDAAIAWFETTFETYVGMAFLPRNATERLVGYGPTLRLNHWPVRSVTGVRVYTSPTLNTPYTAAELADIIIDPSGVIRRYSMGYWATDVEVDYTYGQAAPPADVKDAALWAIRDKLIKDHTGDHGSRQRGVATEGVFVGNTAGPFFNDELNDLANRYRDMYRVPAIA